MKKKIAIMLTLILSTGTFTACTAEEKMYNSSLSPTVSTSAGVSASTESSATATIEKATETTIPEKATVSKETEPSGQNAKTETENSTQKPVQKPTEKPTEKSTQKPTQPPTKAKTVDVQYVVSACIAYGQQLGMKYDSSLNKGNASWFSPTNASYYDDTQSLTADCYGDVEYVAYYYQSSGIAPSAVSYTHLTLPTSDLV